MKKWLLYFCAVSAFFKSNGQSFHLYLIGDAGDSVHAGYALTLLQKEISHDPLPKAVVFLGDNIYDKGLWAEGKKDHDESVLKLTSQLNSVKEAQAEVIFIPGNHDWKRAGWYGLEQVRNEAQFIRQWNDTARNKKAQVTFYPRAGYPGPVSISLDDQLRITLIIFDMQWFLQKDFLHPVAIDSGSSKKEMTEKFFRDFRDMLRVASENSSKVIIVSHHPLATVGKHFRRKEPLYSIVSIVPPLQLLKPLGLNAWFRQDLKQRIYRRTADSLLSIINQYENIIYAAGHDHGLQVFENEMRKNFFLVSGGGSKVDSMPKKNDSVTEVNQAKLKLKMETEGFIKIEFGEGSTQLSDMMIYCTEYPTGRRVSEVTQ